MAAQARVGVAQTAWFPAITLTGNAGHASPELGDLFKWSARAWGVSALLAALWDGGQRDAQVQGANARLEQALASHREQVLTAFREVEDQLASLRWLWPGRGARPCRHGGPPRHAAVRHALPQWSGQPAGTAGRPPQRTAQPPPGAAGAHRPVHRHGGAHPRAGRRLGRCGPRVAAAP